MESFSWIAEEPTPSPNPNPNPNPFSRTKRVRSKKQLEFAGWGSRRLFEFLESIGRDTANKISQYDVASIITDYVNQQKLQHPTKKKRVVCDDRLLSLFGRKTIGRVKIYDLLQHHFADNLEDDSSEDDADGDGENPFLWPPSEDGVSQSQQHRQQKKPKRTVEVACPVAVGPPKSEFAAVIPENIKLVYLRRSLVEKLLEQQQPEKEELNLNVGAPGPQSEAVFEGKVVGSFVRIKSDPNDISQKNSHLLLQVTALNKKDDNDVSVSSSSSSSNRGFLLRLSGLALVKYVPISALSDDNFSPEECDDLRQRIKDGLLKSLTVVELQRKVQILHEDIIMHWLVRELALLQNLIDRANEKGWRRELFEYLERRQLLQTPEEQARLLREVPEVIADEIEVDVAPKEVQQGNQSSPRDIPRGAVEGAPRDSPDEVQGNQSSPTDILRGGVEGALKDSPDEVQGNQSSPTDSLRGAAVEGARKDSPDEVQGNQISPREILRRALEAPIRDIPAAAPLVSWTSAGIDSEASKVDVSWQEFLPTESIKRSNGEKKRGTSIQKLVDKLVMTSQVIDLCDDEENEEGCEREGIPAGQLGSSTWHYYDPQGNVQGPFSIASLKCWSDADYFPPDFKVWKAGESSNQAVLLKWILEKTYPSKVGKH